MLKGHLPRVIYHRVYLVYEGNNLEDCIDLLLGNSDQLVDLQACRGRGRHTERKKERERQRRGGG